MLHKALNSIPARPVLYIVPVIVSLVLGFYYWNLKDECTGRATKREFFRQKVQQAADSTGILKFADFTEFPWQQLKGFASLKPQRKPRNCPFDWDWSGKERQEIIDAGLLSVIIFFDGGSISNYVEFRNDRIEIDDFEKNLTPETAKFRAVRKESEENAYRLTLVR
jgi:hypothetical protein